MTTPSELTTEAWFWRLERSDGVTIGFTSHDRDLWRDDLLFRAKPGLASTTITSALGLDDDSVDVSGALSDSMISDDDLICGRWDAARLTIYRADWTDGTSLGDPLFAGELGGIGRSGGSFVAEVRGPAALLDRPVVPMTSPGCRAEFCDAACGLSAARFTREAQVIGLAGRQLQLSAPLGGTAGSFANGHVRWLSGAATGIVQAIEASGTDWLRVADECDLAISMPARIELREGCDKSIATCATRFDNTVNFRGEPYLPGNDLLTRYPGAT